MTRHVNRHSRAVQLGWRTDGARVAHPCGAPRGMPVAHGWRTGGVHRTGGVDTGPDRAWTWAVSPPPGSADIEKKRPKDK